ncbi:MAG: single-stranded-DNA-specific exonuclease RecJ [Candidatus Omnitrophica bacterium]|nr:single-stranded-DNA-specific exonuclease RecJ [Candidatus Omnitrophota bacterium]
MSKKWRLKKPDPERQAFLVKNLHIHPVVAQLLINRNVIDPVEAGIFLAPELNQLLDPFLLKDMDLAVARLKLARERGENVLVYGDYDVDGVTATAVTYRMLRRLGVRARTYIPHRMEEGYGLNADIITLAKAETISLIITVDCGITAFDEAEALGREGIDLIILDHHEPEGGRIPRATAVVDPKRPDCNYQCPQLAGVGLAAKFVQAVTGVFPEEDLDIITLGTVADVVALTGENRIFVRAGLPSLTKTIKPGLRALIDVARLTGKEMTPFSVGFGLGPRLNAAGRMGSANTSLDLLLSDDSGNAMALAQALESLNRERQKLQAEVVDEAMEIIKQDSAYAEETVIVVFKEGWHKGVLGIAASKITDKFGRPSVVISTQEGVGVGSARSVPGFYLNEAFAHCACLLESFGGHQRAAGLKLHQKNIADFRLKVNLFAKDIAATQDLKPVLDIDAELSLSLATMDIVHTVEALAPYGEGNPVPVFATRRLMVKSRPQVMGKDTIKFWVTDGRVSLSVVGFGMGSDCSELRMGHAVDIAYTLGIDDWNKAPQVQLMLKDIRAAK